MNEIVSKIVTYIFIIIIFSFILNIVRLIYSDIQAMNKKANIIDSGARYYLKLINLKEELYFDVKESYVLSERQTIGRADNNDIVIKDPFLSKRNTMIFLKKGKYYIEDLGGKNGTLLNEEYISDGSYELVDGDRVRTGQVRFLFLANGGQSSDDETYEEDVYEDDEDDEDNEGNDDDADDDYEDENGNYDDDYDEDHGKSRRKRHKWLNRD